MKKFLIILFLGIVSTSYAGTYYVLDSVVVKNANDQVTQKQVYVYNSDHKMVSLSTYTLQDGQLKLYSVSNYEYDVYGNYSMQETYYYSQDTVSLGSRLTYEYDNDRIQWQKSYIYSRGEWELHQGTDYIYDEDGNRIKQYEYYNYSDRGYTYSRLTTYAYRGDTLIADTLRSYDVSASEWEQPYRLHRYEYDDQGRRSVITELRFSSSEEWENYSRTTYEYEDEGRYSIKIDWNYRDDSWIPYSKYIERKRENGSFLMYEIYSYSEGVWVGSSKYECTYNSDDLQADYTLYVFNNGSWEYQYRMVYDYSHNPDYTISRYYKYDNGWQIESVYYSYTHGEESAIDNVSIDTRLDESKPCYDIQGRLISPTEYHGVIIQERHKFLR